MDAGAEAEISIAVPQRVQNRVPGLKDAPQLAQKDGVTGDEAADCKAGAAGVAGATETSASDCPHCLHIRAPTRFSMPQ